MNTYITLYDWALKNNLDLTKVKGAARSGSLRHVTVKQMVPQVRYMIKADVDPTNFIHLQRK